MLSHKSNPHSNTVLYSRNGLQDPQHSPSSLFTYPVSTKCAEEPKNPAVESCTLQNTCYNTVSNSHNKKPQLIVKEIPPLPLRSQAAFQQLKVSKTSPGVLPLPCNELSSTRAGAQPWHWLTFQAIPGKQRFHLFISQEIWSFSYLCSLTVWSFLSLPKPA